MAKAQGAEASAAKALDSADSLRAWLRTEVGALVDRDPDEIRDDEQFARYGLSSLHATRLVATLSDVLGRRVAPPVLWAHPTISDLTAHLLAETGSEATAPSVGSSRRSRRGDRSNEPIAIVGIGCRFPKGSGADAFWRMLRRGMDAVTTVPADRWDTAAQLDAGTGPSMPTRAGFLDVGVDGFDPLFFGISPREAREIDPQQRLFLEVAWEALEDAGLANEALEGSRTGVFAGAIWHDYADLSAAQDERVTPHSATGHALNMVANRLSYALGLRGPSVVVDSACSSSLLAVHLACQSLWTGESTTAIAGGVNLLLSPETMRALTHFGGLAPDGRCKAFDAAADGFGRGEGCGVVVLKPLSRALADNDDIWCTIRGSASNNDGLSNGLTAPSPVAQEELLTEAYRRADVQPRDVHYVETHGTGTLIGDPIEAAALGAVLGQQRPPGAALVIGSVKTNLGHLEGAAGIAGLIKAALCLRHREIPPNLHFDTPNPHIPFEDLSLRVPCQREAWPEDRPLLAGVSSFGWGGSNVHVVLEGWREPAELALPRPLGLLREGQLPDGNARSGELGRPKVAFICSPHGQQWLGMGRLLYRTDPHFRHTLQHCDRELARYTGWSLVDELFADAHSARSDDVAVVQPLLFAIQVGIAASLEAAGVRPDVVVGHSLGEIAAAVIAGFLDVPEAVGLVYHYSRHQQRMAGHGGGMAIVELPKAELEDLLAGEQEFVVVAGENGPRSTNLAGDLAALEAVLGRLKARNVLCGLVRVNVAAHSPAIDPIMQELARDLADVAAHPGRIPMISSVTGVPIRRQDLDGNYFARNLRERVRLADATRFLLADSCDVVVEIGAHPVLLPALQQSVREAGRHVPVLGTMRRGDDDRTGLAETISALAAMGVPPIGAPNEPPEPAAELVRLSAKTPQALRELAGRVAKTIDAASELPSPADVADATARRHHQPFRLAVVARTNSELSAALHGHAAGGSTTTLQASTRAAASSPRVCFVFPGQGSQWAGMGQQLLRREPVFRAVIERCDTATRSFVDWSVLAELEADSGGARLDRIDVVQPVLFSFQVALAALWRSWGIQPDAVVGHSMGEVAAAHVAGALSLEDAALIICRRSRLMRRASGLGAMLAVELSLSEARALIGGYERTVSVAVNNSPRATVLSGARTDLEHIARRLDLDGVFNRWVKVDVASHSPQMDPLRDDLLSAIECIAPRHADVPIYSTVTGQVVDGAQLDAAYWADNLREPVLFAEQIDRLLQEGVRAFLEMSPHPILLPSIEQVGAHADQPVQVLPSLRRQESEQDTMLRSLGELYVSGAAVTRTGITTSRRRDLRLPPYPWQRARFWLDETRPSAPTPRTVRPGRGEHPLLGRRLDSAVEPGTHYWETDLDRDSAGLCDHRMDGTTLVPGAMYVEMALAGAAQVRAGAQFALTDVLFEEPLVLPAGGSCRIQAVLVEGNEPATHQVFAERDDGVKLRVYSASLTRCNAALRPEPVDVAQFERAMTEAIDGDEFYRRLAAQGLEYGPSFRRVEWIGRDQGRSLARIRPPAPAPAGDTAYTVHPALFDAALQTAILPALGPAWGAGEAQAFTSAGIGEVVLHHTWSDGAWVLSTVRQGPDSRSYQADVRVVSLKGEPLLDITGVKIVRLDRAQDSSDASGRAGAAGQPPTEPAASVRESLLAIPDPADRTRELESLVTQGVAQVVHLDVSQIDPDVPLRSLGIDSVMSLELRHRVERLAGLRLSATLIWNYPTVRDIARFIAGKLRLGSHDDTDTSHPPVPAQRLAGSPTSTGSDVGDNLVGLVESELQALNELMENI